MHRRCAERTYSFAAGSAMRSHAICARADWRDSTVQNSGLAVMTGVPLAVPGNTGPRTHMGRPDQDRDEPPHRPRALRAVRARSPYRLRILRGRDGAARDRSGQPLHSEPAHRPGTGLPPLLALGQDRPDVSGTAFVAPGAVLIGRATIGAEASVWYGAVLRADHDTIVVGERSNVQDGCVLHADPGVPLPAGSVVTIGPQRDAARVHRGGSGPYRHERDRAQRGTRGASFDNSRWHRARRGAAGPGGGAGGGGAGQGPA